MRVHAQGTRVATTSEMGFKPSSRKGRLYVVRHYFETIILNGTHLSLTVHGLPVVLLRTATKIEALPTGDFRDRAELACT
jgi:hypothetical protein